jgi:DNA-binding NarL/FixJ family response regulator
LSGEAKRTIALLRQRVEDCRILLLAEGEDVDLLIDGLEAGAQGYVSKESPLSELVDATRAIADGELVIPPGMLKRLIISLVQRRKDRQEGADRMAKLTQRELEVVKLLATGADNEGIGRALVISPQTARTHIQNILSKLGAHSRLEAVAFVRGSGILDDARESAGGGTADEMLEGPAVSRVGRVSERQAG